MSDAGFSPPVPYTPQKKAKRNRRAADHIRFSIGAKLITIISFIVVMSLGSITALVSWLFHNDLQIAAEENNFEANRRSAKEAELTFSNMRSSTRILIQTITAAGINSDLSLEASQSFFEENRDIAAIFFTGNQSASAEDGILISGRFFEARGIDRELADSYRDIHLASLSRAAAGESMLFNAAPHFGISTLAMFFPWKNGGAGILFFSADLNDTFSFGLNKSYLLNYSGDVLVHSDFQLVRAGASMADQAFVRDIIESPERNRQRLVEIDSDPERKRSLWERMTRGIATLFNADAQGDNEKVRIFVAYTKLNIAGTVVITSIEYDKVFEGITATIRRNLFLTGAVLSVSIILIWFFSKSISIPLKALARAARSIEGGIFEVQLHHKGQDEIGLLTASFQKMCSALGIFGRFTNRDIAIKAMRGQIKPGGLPKHATIFFSDIRGFTEKSENFTRVFGEGASDRIVFWLNNYLTHMVECVEKTNGAVDKFIGDAVMAHWGTAYTTGSPQRDAFNCVVSALMMRKALYYMNKERRKNDPGDPPIRIGCGINTGFVTAGQIGSELRMEYTVIGDPVNLASRVEALTKPLGVDILITENTLNMVKGYFTTEEMPSITVKGKEKPVRIYAVVNFRGMKKGPQTLADVRRLLNIEEPDITKVDLDAEEKKYKIGEEAKEK